MANSIVKMVKTMTEKIKKMKFDKFRPVEIAFFVLFGATVLALVAFCIFCPDNLMHSDTTAEVVLSKLLAEEGGLISKNWFYSTEIRIVYTHLVMIPLFWVLSDYTLVKFISVFIFYALLIWAYYMLGKRFSFDRKWHFLCLALLFAPLSNEYLDMMFIGCFYTSQVYELVSYVI